LLLRSRICLTPIVQPAMPPTGAALWRAIFWMQLAQFMTPGNRGALADQL
jgi:hypothetical protein